MSLDEQFERQLPAGMSGAADAFPPHAPDLVQRATARGRRMRRVRTARICASAVALALVAAGGTLLGTSGSGPRPEAARKLSPAATRVAAPRPAAVHPSMSNQEVLHTLESLLPHGGKVSMASGSGLTAQLTYTDSGTSAGVDFSIDRLEPGIPADQQGQGGCLPVEVRPYDVCSHTTRPDGSVLDTTKSFTHPSSNSGQKRWYAVLTTKEGAQLFVEEFGGGGEKSSRSTEDPLLSIGRLSAIVTSPAWDKAVAALPKPSPGATTPTPPDLPDDAAAGKHLASVLVSMLPKGVTISDRNASSSLVQLVFDDGRGKNMVEVDVQDGMTEALAGLLDCSEVSGYCEIHTLADGTRMRVTRQHSEKGGSAMVWLVDTLRPGGHRVLVREVNSYAESGPVTRPQPALSLAKLQEMALSPRWQG